MRKTPIPSDGPELWHLAQAIGVAAQADPRTVKRVLAGLSVQAPAGHRIYAAALRRNLDVPPLMLVTRGGWNQKKKGKKR